jgi:hypothetical protein
MGNRHKLSTKDKRIAIFYPSKFLIGLGYASACALLSMPAASAQVVATPAQATPENQSAAANPNSPNSDSSDQSSSNSSGSNNIPSDNLPASTPASNNPALIYNPTGPYNPLIPSQGANGNAQAPQITTPGLFTTGSNDLSNIATINALSQAFSTQAASDFSEDTGANYSHPPIDRIRLGPVDLKAAISTNIVSDDNLQIQRQGSGKISDTFYTVTPAILLQYGQHEGQKGSVTLTYAPSIQRYLHHSEQDTDNQNVVVNAEYPFQRLTIMGSESYTQGTGLNEDTNTRTQQTTQVSTVGVGYEVDDKISVNVGFQEVDSTFSGGNGSNDDTSSIDTGLTYRASEKLTFGPSFNVGQERPQFGTKSNFEQALVGGTYQATQKISANIQGGVEFRQFDQSGDTADPIFAAGLGYTPFDSTSVALNASESQRSSDAFSNQTVLSTGVGISATQRFFQRIFLTLSVNYEHDDYRQSGSGTVTNNGNQPVFINGNAVSASASYTQDTIYYRPSLAYNPTAWSSIGLYYQYQDNRSSGQGFSYHDNQVGLSVSAQF